MLNMTTPNLRNNLRTGLTLICLCLSACTPALNWRQVSQDGASVQLLFPCKPDQASREVPLNAGEPAVAGTLSLQGCEASGMQFTFAQLRVPTGVTPAEALKNWRLASLAPLQAQAAPADAMSDEWVVKGAHMAPAPVRTRVLNDKHQAHFVWFASADHLYQAAVYGQPKDKGLTEAAETFFSGIKLP
jgi:glucose/arabinose dehydrogenase